MKFTNVSIAGLAHVDPPHRVTSAAISDRLTPALDRLGMRRNVLESASGILARHYWDEGVQPSQAATWAGEKAIADAGIDRAKIGILVSTSVCRDFLEPSVACLVHGSLKLSPDCLNFDLANACLGFMNGMQLVGNMIERGQVDYGLIVDGESARHIQDVTVARLLQESTTKEEFQSQFATLTLGSGAAAMVLCRSDLAPEAPRFTGIVSRAATEHNGLCRGQPDRMDTDAKTLLFAGLGLAQETFEQAKAQLGWTADAIDEAVIHQVSGTHTRLLCETLGLAPEKVLAIYPEFGNIGPASVVIVLSKAREAGRVKKGARVGLMGIGSGLNCAMAEIVW
jgi:3-oxoacyl-[acyl-carrier-protein] synthase-3